MCSTRDKIRMWCVITAFMMLFCTGLALASPTTITLSQVIYDPAANTTKYIYTVTSGTQPSLSHWELAWCAIDDIAELPESEKPELNPGNHADCLDGSPILKFDAGYEDGDVRQVWILLNGDYRATTLVWAATKAGNNDPVCFQVQGPSCVPPAHPAIDIEKRVQGQDADTPTGPTVTVGATVTFTFIVTNTGDVPLTDIVVTDDVYGVITMPKTSLDVGETMTGSKSVVAVAGQHTNTATVTGKYEAQIETDTDPAHYFGEEVIQHHPAIDIEKLVQNQDADTPTGPTVTVGATVTFTFIVTNTGDVPLTDIVVTDDVYGVITMPKTSLDAGETMTGSKSVVAVAGQHTNTATVTGKYEAQIVTDTDPANYWGDEPEGGKFNDLNKDGHEDANEPRLGNWSIVLKNTATGAEVTVKTISDPADPNFGKWFIPSGLEPGTYLVSEVLQSGWVQSYPPGGTYTILINADGSYSLVSNPPTGFHELDFGNYEFAAHPEIDIEKWVQEEDADTPPGPAATVGVTVTFKFIVTNIGNVTLTDIQVTDDVYGVITMPKTVLAPGESMTGTLTVTATEGQHANLATVTGKYEAETVRDEDPAHYLGTLETGCIDGFVYCNGKPLVNVAVRLKGDKQPNMQDRTDGNGYYYFENVIIGVPFNLSVVGYPNDGVNLTINSKQESCEHQNFYLGACKPVLAWYEGWYAGSEDNYRYWDVDNSGGISDTAEVSFYSSHDPDVWEYQILSAWAADVDAFVVDWYGKGSYENTTVLGLLDTAEELYQRYHDMGFDFKIIVCYTRNNSGDQTENLNYLADVIMQKPAYWGTRDNSQRLLFVHCGGSCALCQSFTEEARPILPENTAILWNWECGKTELALYVDGFFTRVQAANQTWDSKGRKWGEEYLNDFYTNGASFGLPYLVGGTWPGMDERNWVLGSDRYIDRQDTLVYEWTWEKAFWFQPNFVMVESWNSYDQGTHIETAYETGHRFLLMTRNKCVLWKSECARKIDNIGLYFPEDLFWALKRGVAQEYIDQALWLFFERKFDEARALLQLQTTLLNIPQHRDAKLVLVAGSETAKGQDWNNAVDGDFEGWDGTTTAAGFDHSGTYGIFEFADKGLYLFNFVYVQTDNGSDDDGSAATRQANDIEVLVSTSGTDFADFHSAAHFYPKKGKKTFFALDRSVVARYVMVVLHGPIYGWNGYRQLVEFGVCQNKSGCAIPVAEDATIAAVPHEFALEQNYPNPFNAHTTIEYELAETVPVSVILYDLQGREVERLVDETQSPGLHRVEWNGLNHASGVYFYRIQAGSFNSCKRMILLK